MKAKIFHLPVHFMVSLHNTTTSLPPEKAASPPHMCSTTLPADRELTPLHSQAVSQAASEAAPAGTGAVHRPGPPSSPVLLQWSEGGGWEGSLI